MVGRVDLVGSEHLCFQCALGIGRLSDGWRAGRLIVLCSLVPAFFLVTFSSYFIFFAVALLFFDLIWAGFGLVYDNFGFRLLLLCLILFR